MEKPLVSVIIATYNRGKYIKRAIESILAQSYDNMEIIVIDNGSTDSTKNIVQSYGSKINYIYQDNREDIIRGYKLISAAKGKYIAILDDDDYWCDNDKIKKQVDFLEKNADYVLVGGGAIKIDEQGKEVVRYLLPEKDEDIRKKILISNTFAHVTVLYRKDAWEKVGGYDEGLDWGLYLKMGKIGKFYNFQEFFAVYMGHSRDSLGYIEKKYGRQKWLEINIALKKKYKNDYPGYRRAVLMCQMRYLYSFLPFGREMWPFVFNISKLFFSRSMYK